MSERDEVKDYLKKNTNLTKEEINIFTNCYSQNNSIKSTAFKLNKREIDIQLYYYEITIKLMHDKFSVTIHRQSS